MKKYILLVFTFFLVACSGEAHEMEEALLKEKDMKIEESWLEELEFAVELNEVPIIEQFREAKGKSIGELLSNNNYMAYSYGGLDTVRNEEELEQLLLQRLGDFDAKVGIHYINDEPPMLKLESLYKKWRNSHDQISATLLGYGYFIEPLENGYFIHLENDFTMSRSDLELVDQKMNEIVAELNIDGLTDYEKVKKLYQVVMDRMEYVSNEIKTQHSPMGFIFHGEGVCQAYAISLDMLLERAGVESRYIIGELHEFLLEPGELAGHAWNMVKLDGQWYHLDPTWDDEMDEWEFFLVSDVMMSYSRSWEKDYYEAAPEPYQGEVVRSSPAR